MASPGDLQEFHYYVQCHVAIQQICDRAVLPCVENVIKNWHSKKQVVLHTTNQQVTLKPCLSPGQCPTRVKDNKQRRGQAIKCPVYPTPCQECINWCHALESVYWTGGRPKQNAQVTWRNINVSQLFHDYIEVAKGFAVSLPPGIGPTAFKDFDPASLLKVMMRFGYCHQNNQNDHDIIQKVLSFTIIIINKELKQADNDINASLHNIHCPPTYKCLCSFVFIMNIDLI